MRARLYAGAAGLALIAGTAGAQELIFTPGEEDRFNWDSFDAFAEDHDLDGETVSISGPWTGRDAEMVENVLAYFKEATGAEVNYSGSDSFEQDIVISAEAGSSPNIAVFPQPGLASDMAERGHLEPLGDDFADWVHDNYAAGEAWAELATYEGPDGEDIFGLFYKVDVKSLVWYSPDQFFEMGYEIPETMEELQELTEQIAADGETPWCIGLGSGEATGWPATGWIEDLMLRLHDREVYDEWVSNDMPFDDPRVIEAIEEFGWFARNDAHVRGGAESVATADWRDSPSGLFGFPPDCYMHKQASFIPNFFPDGLEYGLDYDFFYFPAYEDRDLGDPVMGAGTMFTIAEDSPGARAFLDFLRTPIAHEVWMGQTGFLTPFEEVNPEAFRDESMQAMNEILLDATVFRFDASDMMPGEIGAGAFWTGMVDYVTGDDAGDVARMIQDRWDSMN